MTDVTFSTDNEHDHTPHQSLILSYYKALLCFQTVQFLQIISALKA